MKKIVSLALAGLMAALLFTGCNNLPKIEVSSQEDLMGLKIGVQAGTTGEDWVKNTITVDTPDNLKSFKSGMDAALALKNGQIDAIVLDELPSKSIVSKNAELTIVDLGLEPEEYAIAVKKGNTELVNSINATIKRMKEDGTYQALNDAFMPADGNIVIPADKATEGEKTYKMGTNAAFPPFEYLEGDKIVGFDISMSQEVCADLNAKLEVVNMDFESLLMALDSGNIDFAAAGMSVKPERLEHADFSDTYFSSKQVVILRK